jgi:pimeloyl-ACP methyl ester carboxylesterase
MKLFHLILVAWIVASGCSYPRLLEYNLETPAQTLGTLGAPEVSDGRQRFREIFCELLRRRVGSATDCERRLLRLSDEPHSAPIPVILPQPDPRLVVVVVPGLFGQCVAGLLEPFHSATRSLEQRGYRVHRHLVPGVSSAAANAARIAEDWADISWDGDERIVVIGHSKGTVDMLQFLVDYPEQAARVSAMVSVAGAVNGSPLADRLGDLLTDWTTKVPEKVCDTGDLGAYESLKRKNRLTWLANNPLPDSVAYYSVVGFGQADRISAGLQISYELLANIDPRNDGMLLFYDQVIPGATLLGYANADHVAIVYPVTEIRSDIVQALFKQNDFPREILLEAILLYLSEDFARDASEASFKPTD